MSFDPVEILTSKIVAALPAIASGLLVIAGFWLAAIIARALIRRLAGRVAGDHRPLISLVAAVSYWALMTLGLVSGLGTMGIDVAALVAGLGLTGFALGFALRDAISNLLAGVLVMIYRPFRHGDRISVTGLEGTVVRIDLRYTTMQGEDRRFLIPNQVLFTNAITVFGADPRARPTPVRASVRAGAASLDGHVAGSAYESSLTLRGDLDPVGRRALARSARALSAAAGRLRDRIHVPWETVVAPNRGAVKLARYRQTDPAKPGDDARSFRAQGWRLDCRSPLRGL
jgi:hypothetical protein